MLLRVPLISNNYITIQLFEELIAATGYSYNLPIIYYLLPVTYYLLLIVQLCNN